MNWLSGAFPVGRLFGIRIRVHFLFVIWIIFELIRGGFSDLPFLAMLFGIVLVHEFGHCFGARSVGGYAHDIMMWPLGGLAYAQAPMRPWPQFVTVAAGPAVNVIFCVVTAGLLLLLAPREVVFSWRPWAGAGCYVDSPLPVSLGTTFYSANFFILAFNLLPIYPLDGGQLFHAAIWPRLGLQRASTIACQVGLAGCVLLGLLGIQSGAHNMLLFIAIFGGFTCWQRLQALRQGYIVEDADYPAYDTGANYHPETSEGGFWSRLFKGSGSGRATSPVEFPNPNPGGWEAKRKREKQTEAELDRLLQKVSQNGVKSLSFFERRKLERITRQRQRADSEFERKNRV